MSARKRRASISGRRASIARKPIGLQTISASVMLSAKVDEDEREFITLAWRILSQEQVDMLKELTVHELEAKLAEILGISDYHLDLRKASTLDYYVAGFWFCKEQNFNTQQTSAFFTALKIIFENIRDKRLNLVDNLKELRSLLAGVGLDSSTALKNGGMECFQVEQGKVIADYFTSSVFQHYKLYEFLLHQEQDDVIIQNDLVVEVPPPSSIPFPPPLDEGLEQDIWLSQVASHGAVTEAEMTEGEEAQAEEKSETQEADVANEAEQGEAEKDLLADLNPDDVQKVIEDVANEMLGTFKAEVDVKLKEKEASILTRLNKLGGGK